MNQETRSLLAVGLSVAVFILWYSFFGPKKTIQQEPQKAAATSVDTKKIEGEQAGSSAVGVKSPAKILANDPQRGIAERKVIIESDLYKVTLTNDGGVPVSWQMKKFKKSGSKENEPVELITETIPPLYEAATFAALPEHPRYSVVEESPDKVVYFWRGKDLEITKTYQFNPKTYLMDVLISWKSLNGEAVSGATTLGWSRTLPKEEKRGFFGFLKGPQNTLNQGYFVDGKLAHGPVAAKEGNIMWAGIEDRYFISAILPREAGSLAAVSATRKADPDGTSIIGVEVSTQGVTLLPGKEVTQKFSVYVGPKDRDLLKAAGSSLEQAIDYGWFSFVAVPILYLLKFFYGVIRNYGVAIILLTIFVKLLLNPLTKHSMKSMKGMQVLQPRLKELREKYKNDKERLNAETMQLFKAHKVNPMGGCLPMALQLPIYFALYKVLWNSIELYQAPFFVFYRDLSAPDPYLIMPIILGAAMWLQQKLTPSASADPSQAKAMQLMPIMFTAFMLFLPSGLVLYILVNTVMGILQQYMSNHDIRMRDLVRGKFSVSKA